MKIVCVDNYARESIADRLVAENIALKDEADAICESLNENAGNDSNYFYKVVEDDYRLWRGMEELV